MPYDPTAKLFQIGDFISHAGIKLSWKIECDAISLEEWDCLAMMIHSYEPQPWRKAVGIPRGGVPLGNALDKYSTGNENDPLLIADDVYTTGTSFKEFKQQHYSNDATLQWCAFARQPPTGKVKSLFTLPQKGRSFAQGF